VLGIERVGVLERSRASAFIPWKCGVVGKGRSSLGTLPDGRIDVLGKGGLWGFYISYVKESQRLLSRTKISVIRVWT